MKLLAAMSIADPDKKEQEIEPLKRIPDSFSRIVAVRGFLKSRHDENGIIYDGFIKSREDDHKGNLTSKTAPFSFRTVSTP